MKNTKNYIFLYSELAGYTLACFKEFASMYEGEAKLHVVHFPINPEAPFEFEFPENINFYSREKYDLNQLKELVRKINPDKIACSGWIDKEYLKVCEIYKNRIPVIVTFDNHWEGSIKQLIASIMSPFFIKKYFNRVWVPGNSKQIKFAEKLGFKSSEIATGFYCADVHIYQKNFDESFTYKKKNFPKRLLYVGRYVEVKRIEMLWECFTEIQEEKPNDWELWCLGTGIITPIQHPKIKHFGFVQPHQMLEFVKNAGVYVLPSSFEPWGVAVQEMAIAGMPLICSDAVGAAEVLVKKNENGFIFSDKTQLKKTLNDIYDTPDEKLIKMGEKSNEIGKKINLNQWAETFYNL